MTLRFMVAAILAGLLTSAASAQPSLHEPGSVLVFPYFDSTDGATTLLQITNTDRRVGYCEATDQREGDIVLEYRYCDPLNDEDHPAFEFLVPGDTATVIAEQHDPLSKIGFVVVTALGPTTLEPVDFDHLIGSAVVALGGSNRLVKYGAYSFRAPATSEDLCDRTRTDADGDGARDFDGVEYDFFPETLVLDQFFEEDEERGRFDSQIAFMHLVPEPYSAVARVLFWNNIEQKFSRTLVLDSSFWMGSLSDISAIVNNFGGDEEELGFEDVETGWATFEASRAIDEDENPVPGIPRSPVLAVFLQTVTNTSFTTSRVLPSVGTIDGLEYPEGDGDPQAIDP